jgi:hypothetical protein
MKVINYLLILLLLSSCSDKHFTVEYYEKYPVKFAKKLITYPNEQFELYIPKNWEWKIENYENVQEIELGIDAFSKPDDNNFTHILSIQKGNIYSNNTNLEDEFNKMLDKAKQNLHLKVVKYGKIDFLNNDTYFIHSKSKSEKVGAIEIISFITKSKNDTSFYYLTATASITNEQKMNMAIMIQCLKTFKEK